MTDANFLLDVMLNETEDCIVFVDSEKVVKIGELHPDFTKEDIQAATGCELIFSPDLKPYAVEDEE